MPRVWLGPPGSSHHHRDNLRNPPIHRSRDGDITLAGLSVVMRGAWPDLLVNGCAPIDLEPMARHAQAGRGRLLDLGQANDGACHLVGRGVVHHMPAARYDL